MNELKWLLIILIILLFLFLLILLTKITIYLNYHHYKDDDHLKIELQAWFGLIRYKKTIPIIKIDEDSPSLVVKGKNEKGTIDSDNKITAHDMLNNLNKFQEILDHVFQLHRIVKKFLKKVSLNKFEWYTVIGVGDAAYTGTITGAIWTIKGSIAALFCQYFRVKEMPRLMVQPNFQQVITQTELVCMFQFRIGNAMLAGIKLVKFWKGGRPRLKPDSTMPNEESKSV